MELFTHIKTLRSILPAVLNGLLRRTDARMVVNGPLRVTDSRTETDLFTCLLVSL